MNIYSTAAQVDKAATPIVGASLLLTSLGVPFLVGVANVSLPIASGIVVGGFAVIGIAVGAAMTYMGLHRVNMA